MGKRQKLRSEILQLLFRHGRLTRPELVRFTEARPASVFEAVDELKRDGLAIEPERNGKRTGRKAPAISFSPDRFHFAGLDFQVGRTLGTVVNLTGETVAQAECEAGGRETLEHCKEEIAVVVEALRHQAGSGWNEVIGIGFADPGLVDMEKQLSIRAVNVPEWEKFATAHWLEEVFHLPARIWPEAMVKTYMAYFKRQPNPPESLFYLGLDGGIGGGFIKHGELFVGATGQAMELGHVVIEPDGPLCQCGNRGCLEAIAGEAGIRRKIREARESGVDTTLDDQNFSIVQFVECARHDKTARIIANEIGNSIGAAAATAVMLLNPATIILSGELSGLGELLLGPVRRSLSLNCFYDAVRRLQLETEIPDRFDTATGAAAMMREHLLLSN